MTSVIRRVFVGRARDTQGIQAPCSSVSATALLLGVARRWPRLSSVRKDWINRVGRQHLFTYMCLMVRISIQLHCHRGQFLQFELRSEAWRVARGSVRVIKHVCSWPLSTKGEAGPQPTYCAEDIVFSRPKGVCKYGDCQNSRTHTQFPSVLSKYCNLSCRTSDKESRHQKRGMLSTPSQYSPA